ncbi:DUF6707 family protein [Capnocytophaga gingivalis]|uniref:DUF6707 family protein n=1 Tax=Capnocytophaga gingivalis TaxID=1017 RepID=UPI003C75B391
MNTQVEDILDRILQSYSQDVFTKNIEFIKKTNANLENVDTIQSIKTLAILLEVLGNAELALQTSSIIDKIEFTGDMLIWEKVRDVLILEYFIYQERKEFQNKALMDKMTLVLERGDEAQQRKSKRILDRVLNGSLLHTEEIENAIKRNDIKAEIHHHYLQYNILKYMKIRGGSEAYPIEKLDPMIEEEKQFIAKHINKALF